MVYEYKVVPAPARGVKARGIKTADQRFALALETVMNTVAGEGWEYLRSEALPCEQREGLLGKAVSTRYMLVFRRPKAGRDSLAPTRSAPSVHAPEGRPEVTLTAPARTGESAPE